MVSIAVEEKWIPCSSIKVQCQVIVCDNQEFYEPDDSDEE